MKLICEYPPGTLRNATTVNNVATIAQAIKNMPGVGQPFLIFQSLPGPVAAADLELHPEYVVSSDVSVNVATINTMLADPPLAALTFA